MGQCCIAVFCAVCIVILSSFAISTTVPFPPPKGQQLFDWTVVGTFAAVKTKCFLFFLFFLECVYVCVCVCVCARERERERKREREREFFWDIMLPDSFIY